jgi:hypothetical protein
MCKVIKFYEEIYKGKVTKLTKTKMMIKQKLHSTQEIFTRGGMKLQRENESFEKHSCRRSFDLTMNHVATLTLGSRPRQGLAKVQAKRETREPHVMLLRV